MTKKDKEQMLKDSGFKKELVLFSWWFFTRNNFYPVNTLVGQKGVNAKKLNMLNPTMKGKLNNNKFLLEVDNTIWTKQIA